MSKDCGLMGCLFGFWILDVVGVVDLLMFVLFWSNCDVVVIGLLKCLEILWFEFLVNVKWVCVEFIWWVIGVWWEDLNE